jgi:hypothetical protein
MYLVPIIGLIMLTGTNLMFMLIYWLRLPFFEQYKVEKDEPWPWDKDPVGWKPFFRKTLKYFYFNNIVINFCMIYLYCWMYNFQVPWAKTDPNTVPDSI